MIEIRNGNLMLDNINLLNGDKLSFSYTLKSEDIKILDKSDCTPYNSYKKYFSELDDVTLTSKQVKDGIRITIDNESSLYSEWGINLPFNFMGKFNGGGYKNQYLISSPYHSIDNKNKFIYLSNPNGNNILILFDSDAAGWKIDYSPYCGGHFFINLKLLAQFDKAYAKPNNLTTLSFYILKVSDFNDVLDKIAKYSHKPVLSYDLSGGKIGTSINVKVIGNCDYVSDGQNQYQVKDQHLVYQIKQEGVIALIPYYHNEPGYECTLYGYKNIDDLYYKSINAINLNDILVTDGNLCEHQCYISAALRYLLRYGKNEQFEELVKKALAPIVETDINKAKERITILNKPQPEEGLPAYHIYKSRRIQEQFFGITILLDAYKYFKDPIYLTYATEALNTLIDVYQKPDGGFYTKMPWNPCADDYSTVTCLIIPIIDMALFMKNRDNKLYQKYLQSASKLAEHVFKRGFDFPTETSISDEHEPEMEDGSISCSALTLLYYSTHIKKNDAYIKKAKEILDFHESWIVNAPLCNTYRSSLRWWETGWEGDQDGPAICFGHAWTIWRAEADYWYYKSTNDKTYLIKSINSFNTNFAKIQPDGASYSIYCMDYIAGGGRVDKDQVKYNLSTPFSKQKDSGLSRYVWIRLADSIIDELI